MNNKTDCLSYVPLSSYLLTFTFNIGVGLMFTIVIVSLEKAPVKNT